jgi:hypothetical protein
MTLIDIDDRAAKARMLEIVAANKEALDAHSRRAAELATEERAAQDRDEAALKAAQERKAKAEAATAQQAAEQEKDKQVDEPKAKPKPSTLALGADEFKEARQARKVEEAPKQAPPQRPAPPAEPKDEPKPEPARPSRTMKLGARDDEPTAEEPRSKPEERPARRPRPPRPEGDDDMSGRTWLR